MPHDKNGQLLEPGDVVTVECTVKEVYAGDEYCNVQLETVEPMYPGDRISTITLNAKQVEKAQAAIEPQPTTDEPPAE